MLAYSQQRHSRRLDELKSLPFEILAQLGSYSQRLLRLSHWRSLLEYELGDEGLLFFLGENKQIQW